MAMRRFVEAFQMNARTTPSDQPRPAVRSPREAGCIGRTAWKIAGTLARWSGMDEDAAYQAIIVEESAEPTEPAGVVAA